MMAGYWPSSGVIIRDGNRKSWDPRGPMIWGNFSIFRTNRAILTSYIRAAPRTFRGFSRACCHVAWSNSKSCEILLRIFHSDGREEGREEEPGLFYALLCSELIQKVSFSGSKISLISRFDWIISVRACCTRKLLRLFFQENSWLWYRVNLWVSRTMLNHNQNPFLDSFFYCSCVFGEFAKGKSDVYE